MAFNLGNFAVKEIIYGVAQDFNGNLLYVLDQLQNASIEISSDPTEIVDKRGNVIRNIYNNKSGTFTATSALASVPLMNAQSGSEAQIATAEKAIEMPCIVTVPAGGELDVADAKEGTIHVMGLYGNGANGAVLQAGTTAVVDKTFAYDDAAKKVTVPGAATDAPIQYLVKYDRDVTSGMKLVNLADKFPDAIRLTLYAAVMDPCSDVYKSCYIYLPSLNPDPSVTISLSADEQNVDYNGTLNVSYCDCEKALY